MDINKEITKKYIESFLKEYDPEQKYIPFSIMVMALTSLIVWREKGLTIGNTESEIKKEIKRVLRTTSSSLNTDEQHLLDFLTISTIDFYKELHKNS